ncbi:hypothetical protein [Microvirga alba]|uniref:DUF1036 domain-containing protein n=1 Tax=Microvirga alba TaxID=2791025 RepID=A0A931BQU2_9HYPH|nr:hypothetical protein [Microvirga alba]MBF9234343.1 hypothetical protein [Microvirga alba]
MKWLAAFMTCVLLSTPTMAREVTPAEQRDRSYNANLPSCEDPMVLQDIVWGFARKESRFWDSSAEIVGFERVGEVAWRPWGLDYIPRRFCSGTVIVSDGKKRRINFSIREKLGFIGIGWGTESCVDGFDRDYSYAPHCKQALP